MRGDKIIRQVTREKLLELQREHKTQSKAAAALGLSKSSIQRLAKRYGIQWDYQPPLRGNAAWQELGQ